MRRGPTLPVIILSAAVAAVLAASGCGPGADPAGSVPSTEPERMASARADLAARAAAAQDLVAVTVYTLTGRNQEDQNDRAVMVVRAVDGSWRVDIPGGALGGTADVAIASTADGLFQCALPPQEPTCVRVEQLTPDIDPRVHHVFVDWPDVLTDRAAALAVSAAPPLPDVGGECFSVEPTAASLVAPVDPGIYCYQVDGTLTGAELELGTLTLVSGGGAAPPTVELPGPVRPGDPLPTASPPPPSPSPGVSPSPDPSSDPGATPGPSSGADGVR